MQRAHVAPHAGRRAPAAGAGLQSKAARVKRLMRGRRGSLCAGDRHRLHAGAHEPRRVVSFHAFFPTEYLLCCLAFAPSVMATFTRGHSPPPPSLVLSGHAASLTPYELDTPRPSPRTKWTLHLLQVGGPLLSRRAGPPPDVRRLVSGAPRPAPRAPAAQWRLSRLGMAVDGVVGTHMARAATFPPPLPTVAPTHVPTVHSLC